MSNFFEGKKVLIAGSTGLVGSCLTERLIQLGAKVRATYHTNYQRPHPNPEAAHFYTDLTRIRDCRMVVKGMDYVFMCAAVIAGAGVMVRDPLFNVFPNVALNSCMLQAAYEERVQKYLTFGSSTAYPESPEPLSEDRMMEGEPYEKYFSIGWVMRLKEKLCQIYNKGGLPVVVLRPTNIYGPHDNFDLATSHVTPALIRKAVERHDPLEVWGDGKEVRDLVYVEDVADAALLAMEKVNGYEPINIAAGQGRSVKEILATILDVVGYSPQVVFDSTKPTTIPTRLVDTTKARALLSWQPKVGLPEGIARTVAWYRENRAAK